MRFEKQKKSICFLFMICLLFLGMCFENVQTDSSFLYENTTHTASTLRSVEKPTLTDQVYRQETLSEQAYAINLRQAVRRPFTRTNRGAALNLIFVDILPQISPIIYTSSDCELANESFSNTVIVNYIHHKDGKKA